MSTNRKRIAFVLGSMGKGGAERVISILSRDYAEKGWDTDIIMLLDGRVQYPLHPNTRTFDFSGNSQSRIERLPYWIKSIRTYAKEAKPDIVLSFAARINIITHIACRDLVEKLYVSERNDPYSDGRRKIVDLATMLFYPKDNAVIFQTQRAQKYFQKLSNGFVIANPISVSTYASEKKEKKIVTVGSLKPQKNQALLISAFSKIAKKYPEYTLNIYGEGTLRPILNQQIHNLNLADRVFLRGEKSDVHACIASAELFVLSSDYEGLSNALLEAMMMGLPCISTDCAGTDEYIRNRENGMITPAGDATILSSAMDEILKNDKLRIKCGRQAALDAVAFSKDIVLHRWHNLMDGE